MTRIATSGRKRVKWTTGATAPGSGGGGASYVLDQYSSGILQVMPAEPLVRDKYLWNLYSDYDTNINPTTVTADPALQSVFNQAATETARGGQYTNWQFQLKTYCLNCPGFYDGWNYARRFIPTPASWVVGQVNRLKFRLFLPNDIVPRGVPFVGQDNFQFGTYVTSLNQSDDTKPVDVNNPEALGHWYHLYSLKGIGGWIDVIVDCHPQHLRDVSGVEYGDITHLTGPTVPVQNPNPTYTYMDLLTRFYLDFPWDDYGSAIETFKMRDFVFVYESRTEDTDRIASCWGGRNPSNGNVEIGFNRRIDETATYRIYHSFNDILTSGLGSAALYGTHTPQSGGDYPCENATLTGLSMAGHSTLYVAVQAMSGTRSGSPIGASSTFRQIEIHV